MVKRAGFAVFLLVLMLACISAQNIATVKNKIKTGLEDANFKGNVRCCIDTMYSFKNNPFALTDSIYLGKTETWWFDRNGLLSGHIISGVYCDNRYTFYSNGRKIKEHIGYTENNDTSIADKLNVTYDQYGHLVLSWINGLDCDSVVVDSFTYDKHGNLIETGQRTKSLEIKNAPLRDYYRKAKYAYSDNDQLLWKEEWPESRITRYGYDTAGNLVELSYLLTYDWKSYPDKEVFRYNSKGLKTDDIGIGTTIDTMWHFTYDSLNNVLQEHDYMFTKPITETITHQYKYDTYGNWILDSVSRASDGLIAVHHRKIEYY